MDEAYQWYRRALEARPDHVPSLNMMGLLADQCGQPDEALVLLERAVTIDPGQTPVWVNLGRLHERMGHREKAITAYAQAVRVSPGHALAWYLLGMALRGPGGASECGPPTDSNPSPEVEHCLDQARRLDPGLADAHYHLGVSRHHQGRRAEARADYEAALKAEPGHAPACRNLGLVHREEGRYADALACYDRMSVLRPDSAEPEYLAGETLRAMGRPADAAERYQRALKRAPHFSLGHFGLGTALDRLGRPLEALASFQEAARLNPELVEAHHNLGVMNYQVGKYAQAVQAYQRALEKAPRRASLWHHLGNAFEALGATQPALEAYRQALAIDPGQTAALSALVFELRRRCDWAAAEPLAACLEDQTDRELAAGRKPGQTPFLSLILSSDPDRRRRIAEAWNAPAHPSSVGPPEAPETGFAVPRSQAADPPRILTIGYVSADFRNHPVAQQIAGLFGLHDRQSFKIIGYSYGPDDRSEYRRRIQAGCDQFVDLKAMGPNRMADRIRADEVDILVDLTGPTGDGRTGLWEHRPAPILVSYLGFLGTTGSPHMDYLIADRLVLPADSFQHYTEKVVWLPGSYQVQNRHPIDHPAPAREELGLPREAMVYCSFNNGYKIDREVFSIWTNILARAPQSVLWLARHDEAMERNLRRAAADRGIDPDRLIFAARVPIPAHLARLTRADLALDTLVYNGGATTANALWAGVPVLTTLGPTFVSRLSASHLYELGLSELVARDREEYEHTAVQLGWEAEARREFKTRLALARDRSPLFDTARFARNLEAAYQVMWSRYLAGRPPEPIAIEPDSFPSKG
jgi:predicted O-linked N-acetylglucosamine transferase (SPINDLY family)